MKKNQKGLEYEYKFLSRKMQLYALKYDWAIRDGRTIDAERILKKSAQFQKRLESIVAMMRPAPIKGKETEDAISNTSDRNDP